MSSAYIPIFPAFFLASASLSTVNLPNPTTILKHFLQLAVAFMRENSFYKWTEVLNRKSISEWLGAIMEMCPRNLRFIIWTHKGSEPAVCLINWRISYWSYLQAVTENLIIDIPRKRAPSIFLICEVSWTNVHHHDLWRVLTTKLPKCLHESWVQNACYIVKHCSTEGIYVSWVKMSLVIEFSYSTETMPTLWIIFPI